MATSIDIDWDVEFWSSNYPVYEKAIYNREMKKDPFERLEGLYEWKSLNRTEYSPEELQPFLDHALDITERLPEGWEQGNVEGIIDSFESVLDELRTNGPLSENSISVVTPQFLLHIADSSEGYSGRFPILDVMVARAHRVHSMDDIDATLQSGLTYSRSSYRNLISYFFDRCSTAKQIATLERALFVQGRAIARLRELEGEYDSINKVPVSVAREYLDVVEANRD